MLDTPGRIVFLLVFLLVPSLSQARAKTKPLADLSVVDVRSKTSQTRVLRAVIIREEIYHSLVIELIRRGSTEGDPDRLVKQHRVSFLAKGGAVVDRSRPIVWKGAALRLYVLSGARQPRSYRCDVSTAKKSFGKARCSPR